MVFVCQASCASILSHSHHIKRKYQHFGQAHGTPFTLDPLSNWNGWHGTSDNIVPPDVLVQCTEAVQDIMKSPQKDIATPDPIDISSIMAYESPPVDDDTPRVSDRIFGALANLIDPAIQPGFVAA
jgi:hypothetical protein